MRFLIGLAFLCGCSIDALDPAGKNCPCEAPYECVAGRCQLPGGGGNCPGIETEPIQTISAGDDHSCAIENGALYCWGLNDDGRLGTGDTNPRDTPTQIGSDTNWVTVDAAASHTCAINTAFELYCWGENVNGELGLGDTMNRSTPTRVEDSWGAVTGGFAHTCATKPDGTLNCWGLNSEGALGNAGVDELVDRPRQVDNSDAFAFPLAVGNHSCAIERDGDLLCWGCPTFGEIGQPIGTGGYAGPQEVQGGGCWRWIAGGQGATCGIRDDRTLWCWGRNGAGQAGFGYFGVMGADPTMCGCDGTPRMIASDARWLRVDKDVFHTCAIREDRELVCFGRGIEGQLGQRIGDTNTFELLQVPGSGAWAEVAAGRFHTCARKMDGTVWCTGSNGSGQLGVGDTSGRDEFTQLTF